MKRLLETLILVHQYNLNRAVVERIFTLFLLFVLLPLTSSYAQVKVHDRAIFRVDDKVYFVSDLNKNFSDIKSFRCMKENSVLFTSLGLDSKSIKKINKLSTNLDLLKKEKDYLYKLISLFKVVQFAEKRKVNVDEEKIKSWGIQNCKKLHWSRWPDRFKSLVKTEFYLRERFILKGGKELDVYSLNSFISSIQKKTKHFNFF